MPTLISPVISISSCLLSVKGLYLRAPGDFVYIKHMQEPLYSYVEKIWVSPTLYYWTVKGDFTKPGKSRLGLTIMARIYHQYPLSLDVFTLFYKCFNACFCHGTPNPTWTGSGAQYLHIWKGQFVRVSDHLPTRFDVLAKWPKFFLAKNNKLDPEEPNFLAKY